MRTGLVRAGALRKERRTCGEGAREKRKKENKKKKKNPCAFLSRGHFCRRVTRGKPESARGYCSLNEVINTQVAVAGAHGGSLFPRLTEGNFEGALEGTQSLRQNMACEPLSFCTSQVWNLKWASTCQSPSPENTSISDFA